MCMKSKEDGRRLLRNEIDKSPFGHLVITWKAFGTPFHTNDDTINQEDGKKDSINDV